jgi:hypothetical protein
VKQAAGHIHKKNVIWKNTSKLITVLQNKYFLKTAPSSATHFFKNSTEMQKRGKRGGIKPIFYTT